MWQEILIHDDITRKCDFELTLIRSMITEVFEGDENDVLFTNKYDENRNFYHTKIEML